MENLLLNDGKIYTVDGFESFKELIRDYMGDDAYRYIRSLEEKIDTTCVRSELDNIQNLVGATENSLETLSFMLEELGI